MVSAFEAKAMTAHRRRNGKPLRAVASAQRAREHFEHRRAAAQTPGDIISVASDYVRSAMSGVDPDTARMAALVHAAAMVATADRLLSTRVSQAYDYLG
jgi:K+-transporting ATPase c subunit